MTKYTHLLKWRHGSVTMATCGRQVNWMATRDDVEGVTCPKCHAIASREAVELLTAPLSTREG